MDFVVTLGVCSVLVLVFGFLSYRSVKKSLNFESNQMDSLTSYRSSKNRERHLRSVYKNLKNDYLNHNFSFKQTYENNVIYVDFVNKGRKVG